MDCEIPGRGRLSPAFYMPFLSDYYLDQVVQPKYCIGPALIRRVNGEVSAAGFSGYGKERLHGCSGGDTGKVKAIDIFGSKEVCFPAGIRMTCTRKPV